MEIKLIVVVSIKVKVRSNLLNVREGIVSVGLESPHFRQTRIIRSQWKVVRKCRA